MEKQQTPSTPQPMEKAVLNFTDSKLVAVAFFIALIMYTFFHKRLGVRILKVELTIVNIVALLFITFIADFINKAPLINANLDFGMWLIFTFAYIILAVIATVKAHLETRKPIYTHSRYMGDSRLWPLFEKLNVSFLNHRRFQVFVEPVIVLILGHIIYYTVAANLGIFIIIGAKCMFIVSFTLWQNLLEWKYSTNDSLLLGQSLKSEISPNHRRDELDEVQVASRVDTASPVIV